MYQTQNHFLLRLRQPRTDYSLLRTLFGNEQNTCISGKLKRGWIKGNQTTPQTNEIPNSNRLPNNGDPLARIHHIRVSVTKCPHIHVHVFETEIDALLDSGAGISVINSSDIAER